MQKQPSVEPAGRKLAKLGDASIALNLSLRSTQRLVALGHLRAVRAGRSVRIPIDGPGSINAFIERGGAR